MAMETPILAGLMRNSPSEEMVSCHFHVLASEALLA